MKPIICIHGLQGSGKTYLIKHIKNNILNSDNIKEINIKSTFMCLVDIVDKFYDSMGYKLDESQRKKLMLNESTYGEQVVDSNIWTNEWKKKVNNCLDDIILVDDIRTTYNLEGLLSLDRPIILFKLDVPEDIRRHRLGANWRDNGGYTEMLLEKPSFLPKTFEWVELGPNWDAKEIENIISKYI